MNNIVPTPYVTTLTIIGFKINITEFIPNTSVYLCISVYSENQNVIKNDYLLLDGQAYLDWGNDDDYLVQWVATQLGFTLV
jgi:hypothetical protein